MTGRQPEQRPAGGSEAEAPAEDAERQNKRGPRAATEDAGWIGEIPLLRLQGGTSGRSNEQRQFLANNPDLVIELAWQQGDDERRFSAAAARELATAAAARGDHWRSAGHRRGEGGGGGRGRGG